MTVERKERTPMTKGTISRRGFMKAAAATGAALTAAGSIPLLETTDQAFAAGSVERVMHKTACHGCTNCCPVRVYTEDGRVVKIEGDPDGPLNKGGVCLKCLTLKILPGIQPPPRAAPHEARRRARREQVGGHQLGRGR